MRDPGGVGHPGDTARIGELMIVILQQGCPEVMHTCQWLNVEGHVATCQTTDMYERYI